MRTGIAALAAAGCLAVQCLPAAAQRAATITVSDHLGDNQVEETIMVYLQDRLVGTLHVAADHPIDSFTATVPDLPSIRFALCGKLLTRDAAGTPAAHAIDNGGTLSDFAGRGYDAITMGDVVFTLQDPSGQGRSTVARGPACTAAVS